jgi:hypothetical protein
MATQERRRNTTTAASDRQDSPLVGDLVRLRAGLRLLFEGEDADRLAALALGARGRGRALRRVVQAAGLLYALIGLRDRLRRRPTRTRDAPLGPETGLPARAALALALHLGLNLDGVELAETLHLDLDDVGLALDRARQAIHPELPPACAEYAALAARYRDRALDPGDRLALLKHPQACARCRDALEARQRVDEGLIAAIDAFQSALPSGLPRPSRAERWLPSPAALLLILTVLVVALIAAGSIAWDSLSPEGRTPVPLASAATPVADGWLLIRGESGSLDALNLATGERRTLIAPPPGSAWPEYLLSPDGRLIAELSEGPPAIRIAIYRLDGSVLRTWSWEQQRLVTLSGWLNGSTLLIVERPAPAPVENWLDEQQYARIVRENYAKEMRESELLALDVQTGYARTLARGGIASAFPSPDGTLIAIIEPHDPAWPGWTLVLRPLDPDGLGPALATVERRLWGLPAWAPDSSRLYLGRIADPEISPRPLDTDPFAPTPLPRQVDLVVLDRQGRLSTVVPGQPGQRLGVLAVSLDDRALVYWFEHQETPERDVWETWRVGTDGTNRQRLASGLAYIAWTGDGAALLLEPRPFFLPGAQADGQNPYYWSMLTLVEPDGTRQALLNLPGAVFYYQAAVLPWLPSVALPTPTAEAPPDIRGEASAPRPVPDLPAEFRLDARSSVSPDGQYIILTGGRERGPVVWDLARGGSRFLRPDIVDLSWFLSPPALVGATQKGDGAGGSLPRGITFYPGETLIGAVGSDAHTFDPLGIASDPHRRYARPLVSPNGLAVAFFVVDDEAGTVELWISTAGGRTEQIPIESRWPAGSPLGEARPAALWLDRQTLLYAGPEGWQGGLPQRVTFWRVTVGADDRIASEPVFSIEAGGRETGLLLAELALSPDGARLAYRLRHFTRSDPESSAFDTLVVVPVADASRRLEVARGEPGEGLDWSPDSRWLVAGLRGRVVLVSADGRQRLPLSPEDATAVYPLWIGPHTIWYQQATGDEERVMAVEVW